MKPFYKYLLYYLSLDIYLAGDISLCINFQWVYSVGDCLCYYTCFITCMCDEPLNACLVSRLLGTHPTNVTLVNISSVTSVLYLQG